MTMMMKTTTTMRMTLRTMTSVARLSHADLWFHKSPNEAQTSKYLLSKSFMLQAGVNVAVVLFDLEVTEAWAFPLTWSVFAKKLIL